MREFGLIGLSLQHSFSQRYFTEKFFREGITDAVYSNYELRSIDHLPLLLKQNKRLRGLNVTIPFKEQVLPYIDHLTPLVETIGACNCIKIDGEETTAYNTDVPAFKNILQSLLKPQHKKALVLGSGGASKAIKFALEQLAIEYTIVSRKQLEDGLGYEDIDETILHQHKIVINTTPVGQYPNIDDQPPLPYDLVGEEHLFFDFDLIYNPPKTKFLAKAEKRGATISNGQAMLVMQAEESWRIWNEASAGM
jgi:shikimate dehydrogenase